MSGKGNCYDNASVETFFKSLKAAASTGSTTPADAIHIWAKQAQGSRLRKAQLERRSEGGISPLAFEAKVA